MNMTQGTQRETTDRRGNALRTPGTSNQSQSAFIHLEAGRKYSRIESRDPIWLTAKRHVTKKGYVLLNIYIPELRRSVSRLEHIWMWERYHGERLPRGWVIHHVNERPDDNDPITNLVGMPRGMHRELHVQLRHLARECTGLEYVRQRHALTQEYIRRSTELEDLRNYWYQA